MPATTPGPRSAEISAGRIALAVGLGVIVGAASVYVGLEPLAPSVLPTLWQMANGCPSCGVAANHHDVYRLVLDSETEYGNTTYTISANNLSSGAVAWLPVTVFVRQGFGFYQGTVGEIAPFLANHDTLSLVVDGTGEWASGQKTPDNLSGFGVFVLEWNASTGSFLGVQSSLEAPLGFTYVAATQSDGWLVVDWVGGGSPTNVYLETFPEQSPGAQYSAWTRNISIPAYSWIGWPLLPLTVGSGLVTITVLQPNGTTAIISGVGGALDWEGPTPWLYSGEGYLGTVEYYNDVTRIGDSLYYLGNETTLSLMSFNLTTRAAPVAVATLPIVHNQFPSSELEGDHAGDLIVTDAWNGTYFVYAPNGVRLWTDHIALSVTSEPATGGAAALAFEPVELSGRYLFTALFEDQSWVSGPTGSSYSFHLTSPLQLLNESTGRPAWHASYPESFTMGNPGPSTRPLQFLPVTAAGLDLVYLYGPFGPAIGVASFS